MFKTAGAMDSFVERKTSPCGVTDLNVGDTAAAAHPADFEQLVKRPGSKRTSHHFIFLYRPQTGQLLLKCTGGKLLVDHKMQANLARRDFFAGRMMPKWKIRLMIPTHSKFEPGDCFLIYPDENSTESDQQKLGKTGAYGRGCA